MATLCAIDTIGPNTMPRSDANRERAIRAAVTQRCNALNLSSLATQDAISAAMAEKAFGGSTATAIAAGVAKAERTAAALRVIRTRYGTRNDPEPPLAA